MTVALRVPEGALAKHLIVVDESGGELATLTLWASGMTTVVSRRGTGVVSAHLREDGSARMRVDGTAWTTLIDTEPDGTSRSSHHLLPPGLDRPGV
jgi:hypothetical protein